MNRRLIQLMGFYVKLSAACHDEKWLRVQRVSDQIHEFILSGAVPNEDYIKGRKLIEGCIKVQDGFTLNIYIMTILELYAKLLKDIFSNGNAE